MNRSIRNSILICSLILLLAGGAAAQALPPGFKLPSGKALPTNLQLPQGMSAAQAQQMLRQLEKKTPSQAAAAQQAQKAAQQQRAQAAELVEAEQLLRKEEAKEERQERQLFVQHVRSMVQDGELGDEEARFLEVRAVDLEIEPDEAQQIIDSALHKQKQLERYRAYLEAFYEDGVIDRTEAGLLAAKRGQLQVDDQDHKAELARVRKEVAGRPLDVLHDIKETTPLITDKPLERFGRHLFQLAPEVFAPPAGLPPPDNYVVGLGDQFLISLWGRLEAEYTLAVDGEGKVLFPQIGPVPVAGLSYAETRGLLQRKAESITGVSAAVSLTTIRSVQVFVVGEAAIPGAVTLSPLSTVIQAVMKAGGPTDLGSLREVELRRGGQRVASLDLYDFLRSGQMPGDRPLETGDVIVIPKASKLVHVMGKVKRPAIYSLRKDEGLHELIELAGGLAADADADRVQVSRAQQNDTRVVLDVAYAASQDDFALEDGDRIRVFPLKAEIENELVLYGHVHEPGRYAYRAGMRVADLIGSTDNLRPDVELSYAVVLRETGPDRSRSVLPFHLGQALDGSEPGENLELQPRDEVYVFDKYRFRPRLRAIASGLVRNPGLYRFEEGARIADLVRLAGGLQEEALLSQAELLRYLPDRTRETIYLDLNDALQGKPQHNLALRDEDRLVVRSVWSQQFEEAITIEGEIKQPGEIDLTRGLTVRDLVFKAGGLTKDAYLQVAHLYRTDRSSKEVTIHTFHLGKALAGDPDHNLPLQDQDNVVVHNTYQFAPKQQVVVAGKVNRAGTYPFATNMRVRDLVLAAGGLTEDAYLGSAEVVRSEVLDGEIVQTRTIPFSLERAMAGEETANFQLEPYDKLFVKTIPEWRETRKIMLHGEILFPGVYYIAKGERLSSVLRRAGGFTEEAYLRGALFTRESSREHQQQRLDELREDLQQAVLRASSTEAMAALNPEDAIAQKQYLTAMESLLHKLEAAKATGRVIISMKPIDELEGSEFDIFLEDGDTLTIPQTPQTVAVVGQVYNPTSILWDPEQDTVEYYLQKTGGPTHNAEIDRMYVVRADGTVVSETSLESANWWARGIENLELYPGDAILVPEKIVHVNYMKEIRDITQILYQIAVTAGVAVLLF